MSQVTSLQSRENGSTERTRIVLAGSLARQTITALSDEFSKRILESTITKGKTIQEISEEQAVPLSTCYRRAREMVDQGLLLVERIVITPEGRKYAVYKSSFKEIEMASDFRETSLTAELNDDVSEKFRSVRLRLAYHDAGS